jgi:hypothetical protein
MHVCDDWRLQLLALEHALLVLLHYDICAEARWSVVE